MFTGSKKFVTVALFTAMLIVLVNLAWWFYYEKTEQLLDQQLSRRLAAVAQTAATALDPAAIDQLAEGSLDGYLDVIEVLRSVRESDSLSDVFILDEGYSYLATTMLETDSVYFLAELNSPQIDSLFFGEAIGAILTPTYQSGTLFLKTAFAPLYGEEGFVVAVLGVEANVDYFDALNELRQNLRYATGLSLVGGLVLGLLFLLLQRRINRAEQQLFLGQTHAHLGRMVAVVAHELKNPLMIIRGSAERITRKTEMPEAAYVVEEIDRLDGIVTGYLDFARSGGSLLAGDSRQTVDLVELCVSVQKHLFEKYAGEEIIWLGGVETPSISIEGYPRSLRQVILNLLINGVESCREAGKPIEVGLNLIDSEKSITLIALDHGGGIESKELKKVFTPFYTTRQSGSGLGLYLSRKIVMQMNGRMNIKSEPDLMTEVIISLPKEPKA